MIPATFVYQTTNPATNAVTGTPNTPVNIAPGKFQSFVIAFTPNAPFGPTDVTFGFTSTTVDPAPTTPGVNTLLLSASANPVPDIVALAATASNDGILHISGNAGSAAFAVATVNVGASAQITATANTGAVSLPLAFRSARPIQQRANAWPHRAPAPRLLSEPTRHRPSQFSRPQAARSRSCPLPTASLCSSATGTASCAARPALPSRRNDSRQTRLWPLAARRAGVKGHATFHRVRESWEF